MMEGVDYSWGRPDLDELWALGVRFVSRYLAPLSGKVLLPAERAALHARGFMILLNWENRAGDMLAGYDLGLAHASEAKRQAEDLGAPPDVPIYFSCDFDATPDEMLGPVARYLDACVTVLGWRRVGVYGKADVIDALVPAHAYWGWQTYAWSRGRVSDKAHALQYRNNVQMAGAAVDLDRSLKPEFGQWEVGDMVWYKAGWIPPFFAALDTIAPNRDRASDGTIGDTAHQGSPSGHNPDDTPGSRPEREDADTRPEVRAADAGTNFRAPITMQQVVDAILAYPPDRNRLIYIIFNGWIWSASAGWARQKYNGSDQHTTHVHLSGNPNSDDDARPWVSILNLTGGNDMNLSDASPWTQQYTGEEGYPAPWLGGNMGNQLQYIREDAHFARTLARTAAAEAAGLRTVIETLAAAIAAGGGSVDTVAILAGVDTRLAALAAEQRDAVADLGEGGAAQVRADA